MLTKKARYFILYICFFYVSSNLLSYETNLLVNEYHIIQENSMQQSGFISREYIFRKCSKSRSFVNQNIFRKIALSLIGLGLFVGVALHIWALSELLSNGFNSHFFLKSETAAAYAKGVSALSHAFLLFDKLLHRTS